MTIIELLGVLCNANHVTSYTEYHHFFATGSNEVATYVTRQEKDKKREMKKLVCMCGGKMSLFHLLEWQGYSTTFYL